MSTNLRERIERVVDKALKEAALGEPYGFTVTGPAMWGIPLPPDGKLSDPMPAWFIVVTIRATGVGEPDIGNGYPVPGALPKDDEFTAIAAGLLEKCRSEREKRDAQAFQMAGPSMKLTERPNG